MASRLTLCIIHILSAALFMVPLSSISFANDLETSLHIAVASNFKQVQQALTNEFLASNATKSLNIVNSSGSSGTLFAQIKHGAPYDLFLSADQERPETLINLGLALKKSRIVYAQGQIVLWQPLAPDPFNLDIFKTYTDKYVLANPKLAPYGAASHAIMKRSGLWKPKDNSRIVAQNIATTFQYVASGSIKMGWVAYSQLKKWQQKSPISPNSYWLPPVNHYPAIYQVAVQLKRASKKTVANEYLAFLSTPKAQSLIRSFGYLIPSL